MNIHIVGICGKAIAYIATECQRLGHTVTGSDNQCFPPVSHHLEKCGIPFQVGYRAENVPAFAEVVILNTFVKRHNPELREALRRRLEIHSFPSFLEKYFLSGKQRLVIAGTKGKSTTTAMLAHILKHVGRPPACLVGGEFISGEKCVHFAPEAETWVIEGDEYWTGCWDTGAKFSHYWPEAVCLTNLEDEHLDIYRGGFSDIRAEYLKLVEMIPANGWIVYWAGDERTADLAVHCEGRHFSVGVTEGMGLRVMNVELQVESTTFLVNEQEFRLKIPGTHNAWNAALASGMALPLGISLAECAEALASFQGLRNRQELAFEIQGVRAYDEPAKNWLNVSNGQAAVRQMNPGREVVIVYRPNAAGLSHQTPQLRLPAALATADQVLLLKPTRQTVTVEDGGFDVERLGREIRELGTPCAHIDEYDFQAMLPELARPGTVFVFYYAPYGNPLLDMLRTYLETPDLLAQFTFERPLTMT